MKKHKTPKIDYPKSIVTEKLYIDNLTTYFFILKTNRVYIYHPIAFADEFDNKILKIQTKKDAQNWILNQAPKAKELLKYTKNIEILTEQENQVFNLCLRAETVESNPDENKYYFLINSYPKNHKLPSVEELERMRNLNELPLKELFKQYRESIKEMVATTKDLLHTIKSCRQSDSGHNNSEYSDSFVPPVLPPM